MGKTNAAIFVLAVTLVLLNTGKAHEKERCLAVLTPDFKSCDNLSHGERSFCSSADVCAKSFRFSTIEVEPFVHILEKVVINAIEMCCGDLQKCRNGSHYEEKAISMRNLSRANLNESNFIFPILGHQSINTIYGFHFIPVLQLSNGYFVTKAITSAEVLRQLIRSCTNLWPLLVIVILLSVIAGFVIWVLETWFNPLEFPRKFFRGLFESFWWAFVSMTTVGYGDKIPKSVLSRLWAVIWILTGITISSIFVASLTNEITSASNAPDPTMHGKKVGVFKYRPFDAAYVAKQGGRIKETRGISEDENIQEIKNMLSSGAVDGIFMDKFTYMYSLALAKGSQKMETGHHDVSQEVAKAADFFLEKTHRTKLSFEGEDMVYGILVRDEEDYDYFAEFLRHNRIVYETCALLHLNEDDVPSKALHDIFSTEDEDGPFFDFLYWCSGIIAGICVAGVLFEAVRRGRKAVQVKDFSA